MKIVSLLLVVVFFVACAKKDEVGNSVLSPEDSGVETGYVFRLIDVLTEEGALDSIVVSVSVGDSITETVYYAEEWDSDSLLSFPIVAEGGAAVKVTYSIYKGDVVVGAGSQGFISGMDLNIPRPKMRPIVTAMKGTSGVVGVPLTFSCSFEAEADLSIAWDYNGDGVFDRTSLINTDFEYSYAVAGTYTAVVRLTSGLGLERFDSVTVVISEKSHATLDVTAEGNAVALIPTSFMLVATPGYNAVNSVSVSVNGTLDTTLTFLNNVATYTNTFEAPGIDTLIFGVVDSEAYVVYDTILVTVAAKPNPTIAAVSTAAAGVRGVPHQVAVTATAYNDGAIASYSFDFDGDGTVDLTGAANSQYWTYAEAGNYTVIASVMDSDSLVAVDSAHVVIELSGEDLNTLPDAYFLIKLSNLQGDSIAQFVEFTGSINDTFMIRADGVDADGNQTIQSMVWDYHGDGQIDKEITAGFTETEIVDTTSYVADEVGIFTHHFIVTDMYGGSDTAKVRVEIVEDLPIIGECTVDSDIEYTESLTLSCAVSDGYGEVVSISVDFGVDGADAVVSTDPVLMGQMSVDYTYANLFVDSIFTAVVSITDDDGNITSKEIPVSVTNSAPTLSGLTITPSSPGFGDELTADFSYADANGDVVGDTLFQWYADDVAIDGETNAKYTTLVGDIGKVITVKATPIAATGNTTGIEYESPATIQIAGHEPVVNNIAFSGTLEVGTQISVDYEFSDGQGDLEGTSIIKWYRGDVELAETTKNYTLVEADNGTYLTFEVTPVAQTGDVLTGATVRDSVSFNAMWDSRDAKLYRTVTIGEQTWMAENLRYDEGVSSICHPDDCNLYGRFYLWADAVGESSTFNPSGIQGVCFDGWHVPSVSEFQELSNYVSANKESGDVNFNLRSTTGWGMKRNNAGADGNGSDSFDFTVLPAGYYSGGSSHEVGDESYWMTSNNSGNYSAPIISDWESSPYLSYMVNQSTLTTLRCVKN